MGGYSEKRHTQINPGDIPNSNPLTRSRSFFAAELIWADAKFISRTYDPMTCSLRPAHRYGQCAALQAGHVGTPLVLCFPPYRGENHKDDTSYMGQVALGHFFFLGGGEGNVDLAPLLGAAEWKQTTCW